jgi:hypothetical protein
MSRRSEKLLLVLLVSLVTIFGTGLYAQENVGHIRGTVSDATGAVIPDVTVTLAHEATGVVKEVATNSAGAYAFIRLPLGEYSVRTRAEGFKSGERLLRIVSFVTQTVDFALEIGDVTETVSVTAQVLTVDTSSNVVGTTRTTEEITELPLLMSGSARSATDFLRTMPGVIFSPTDALTDQAFISGAPQGGAAYQIDGLMASVSGHGQLRDSQTPEPEGFEEFRLSNNTNAEYGWNSGVQVSLVTKSGTNDLHGTLYHYLRNEALDSAGWLSGTVSKNKQNEWGLFVGGPLVKDRVFATFGYKAYRFRVEPNNATLSAPTPLMRQGDFSEWLGPQIEGSTAFEGQIYDPATTRSDGAGGFLRDPFPNNAIPQGRLSPISQFLQKPYPLPTQPGTLGNWIGSTLKNFNDLNRYQTKIDYYIDSQARHRVSFFYSHLDGLRQLGGTFPDPRVTSAFGIIDGAYRTRMHYDWTISPTLLFGIRAGFNRTPDSNLIAVDGARTQGCDSGLQGTITCETPSISFDSGTTGMGFFFSNVKQQEQTLPAAADLNWTKGNHNFKIGVQFLSNVTPQNVTAWGNGEFNFTSRGTDLPGVAATGNAYASFLLGEVNNGQLWSSQDARWSTNTWGFYVQDSWRVRPKLTLNYGLRWDLFLPLNEGYDRIANFDPNLPNPGMDGRPGAITFFGEGPGRNGRTSGVWDVTKNAFSPRFGLAYTLTDKTLIRASYGLSSPAFFGLYGSGFRIRTTGFMQLRATFQSIDNGVTPAFNWNGGVPDVTGVFSGSLPNLDPAIANGFGHPVFFPEQIKPGLNQNINFGLERDLGGGMILRSDYVALLATGLPSDGHIRLNQMPLSALSLGSVLNNQIDSPAAIEAGIEKPYASYEGSVAQALRPFPAFQTVNDISSPTMNMQYHSLQTTLQKRFGHGLNFLFAYTISKTLANAGGFGGQGQASGRGDLQHTDQRGALKGLFAADRPQQINLSYLYELPFGPGKRFGGGITNPVVKHLVGGWRLSAIQHYWRESPIKVTTSAAVPGGLQSIWANREQGEIATGQGCGDYSSGDVSLNAGAFSVPGPFQLGDTRILPSTRPCGYMNENIAIQKIFPFREHYKVEFAAEFINIFNRHNVTGLQTNVSNSSFGQYFSTTLPRRIQFHLKFRF